MQKTSRIHVVYGGVVAILLCTIGLLAWRLLGYSVMYQRNVDYCSELAFAYGYAFGHDQDIDKVFPQFHHRLTKMEYQDKTLSVEIWPAKDEWLIFSSPRSDGKYGGTVDCLVGGKAEKP